MRSSIILLIFFLFGTASGQHSTISGKVSDNSDKSPLPFASIVVKGTTIGTTSDLNGKYNLSGVPVGPQVIDFRYLGYKTESLPVTVVAGKTTELNASLNATAIQSKEVIVVGQARGQVQAINQQLNSASIVNVVSLEKMKELPDVNAAEAIGRLPGIMVQRSGGEGEKVIIRGLDPKYSTVAVNGVVAPSSSSTDRSTNMNLISPEIISSIEVMKANTADKDADGMGGTVNMLVKEADKDRKLNVTLQGGYSGQIKALSNYKGVLFYSDRYFNKKLGMMLAGNIESYDRSSDELKVSYTVTGDPVPPAIFVKPYIITEKLYSNITRRNRTNASAIFDFSPADGHIIKMINLFSRTNQDSYERQKGFAFENGQLRFSQTDFKQTSYMLSNAFDGKHSIGITELTWNLARSQTLTRSPDQHIFEFRHTAGFAVAPTVVAQMDPLEVPDPVNLNEQINVYNLYDGILLDTRNVETEWSSKMDLKVPFSLINEQVSGYLKFGGKARFKTRERNTDRWSRRLDLSSGLNAIVNRNDYTPSSSGGIGIESFLDPDFQTTRFLDGIGQYLNVNYALDREKVREFYSENNPGAPGDPANLYLYTPAAKVKDDYKGRENLYAFYLMSEINIGRMITFIPGVRYDYSNVNYMAYKGEDVPDSYDSDNPEITVIEQWARYKQYYLLPMIHLKIKPLNWFDVRFAYTQTLSRPDYDYMAPRTQISPSSTSVIYSSPILKSSLSENFDLIGSFYKPSLGLLTVGAFRKNIENFIYKRTAILTIGTSTDPSNFSLSPTLKGYTITYPRNNPATSFINGLEIEGQTSLKWAPQPFTGIVLSGNLTFMNSRSTYQATLFQRIANPNFGQFDSIAGVIDRRRVIVVNYDTAYVDRLVKQPSFLANLSVGYDLKGFSARISYSYQANILNTPQIRPDGADKEIVMAFSRWDLQVKQKIFKKMSIFFNMTNILNFSDRSIREVTGYYTSVEYYGMAANLGIKLDIY